MTTRQGNRLETVPPAPPAGVDGRPLVLLGDDRRWSDICDPRPAVSVHTRDGGKTVCMPRDLWVFYRFRGRYTRGHIARECGAPFVRRLLVVNRPSTLAIGEAYAMASVREEFVEFDAPFARAALAYMAGGPVVLRAWPEAWRVVGQNIEVVL